jgi:hypothetical protein
MKLLVYGRGKVGKTRLVATFPKPLILIGTEDGTKALCVSKEKKIQFKNGAVMYKLLGVGGKWMDIDFVQLERPDQLDEVVSFSTSYASVGLDTAGGLQDLIFKSVLGLENVPVQKTFGMADRQTWGIVGVQFKERVKSVIDLADQGVQVGIIAHERSFKEEGESEIIAPTVGAALTPSAAGWLNGQCDYIAQAFIRAQTVTTVEEVGDVKVPTVTKTGRQEYCLRIGPHEVFMTGFRLPLGVDMIESGVVVNPSYDKLLQVIGGEYKDGK